MENVQSDDCTHCLAKAAMSIVQSAAQVRAHGDIGSQADPGCINQQFVELLQVSLLGLCGGVRLNPRVVKLPIALKVEFSVLDDQGMGGRQFREHS